LDNGWLDVTAGGTVGGGLTPDLYNMPIVGCCGAADDRPIPDQAHNDEVLTFLSRAMRCAATDGVTCSSLERICYVDKASPQPLE
jgi:hypothetical protein